MHWQLALAEPIIIGVVSVLLAIVLWCTWRKKSLPLPPFSSASLLDNLSAPSKQKTLFQHERNRRLFHEFDTTDFGSTPFGSVFRSRFPFWHPLIMVSDYVLARKVLIGDASEGIKEGEKAGIVKSMNLLDRGEFNILTHQTSNEDRERARKTIAQSFSTSNLMKTWPHIKGVIEEQFAAFRTAEQTGSIVDMKPLWFTSL